MLDPERHKPLQTQPIAILNRDDVSYEVLKPYCRVPILDYGIDAPAAVRAVDLQLRASSTQFRAILPDTEVSIETQLVGRFNVSNCLAAIATAYSQGVKPAEIASGLAGVIGVTGRMEHIDEGQSFAVIVDYAHTPDSLEKVLAVLRPLTPGKMMAGFWSSRVRGLHKTALKGGLCRPMFGFFVIVDYEPLHR